MLKYILIFIALILTGYFASFISKEPGEIIIEWYGWLIETSVTSLFILTTLSFIIMFYFIKLIFSFYKFPRSLQKKIMDKRHKKGLSSLYSGLSALSMNEKNLAEEYYKKSKNLLKESPLKLILEMEISKNKTDKEKQISVYEKMLPHKETKLLALKNWINYSIINNNMEKVYELSELIPKKNNTPKWFYEKLLLTNIQKNNWGETFSLVKTMTKYKIITTKEKNNILGKLYYGKFLYLYKNNKLKHSLKNISFCLKYTPNFSPAIVEKAKILYKMNPEKGIKYSENMWQKYPSRDLIIFFSTIFKNYTKLKFLNYISSISSKTNNDYIKFLICELAVKAEAWQKATKFIEDIPEEKWTKKTYALMSQIDGMGNGNVKMSNLWLEKIKNADGDYNWGCMSCSFISEYWNLVCPKCFAVNSMNWDKFESKVMPNYFAKQNIKQINLKTDPESAARGVLGDLKDGVDR